MDSGMGTSIAGFFQSAISLMAVEPALETTTLAAPAALLKDSSVRYGKALYFTAPSGRGCVKASRTGMPVKAILPCTFFGKYGIELSKDTAMRFANFAAKSTARLGFESDSCTIIGIPRMRAARTTGTLP